MGGDLDPVHGMYWTWQSGYIHMNLEARTSVLPGEAHRIQCHLGGYAAPFNTIQQLGFPLTKESCIAIQLDQFLGAPSEMPHKVMSPSPLAVQCSMAQVSPAVSAWLQNTTGITGRHYVNGNSTPVVDAVQANVQSVSYSSNWVYVQTNGIPAYPTGPFLDGNPSLAQAQTGYFKMPLNPVQNTGNPTPTTMGNIGIFINGVALFDSRDGVSWRTATNSLAGGPLGGQGDNVWNRDAIVAERAGFDCSKGHPAMGNYHHHQNPSAFNLDLQVISSICDIYVADGLYVLDSTVHSPLIGYAYDGFPIYGAFGYRNTDGTGGITRIQSGYSLRNITTRTTLANGTDVADGPAVSSTYPLGYFREDYEYINPGAGHPEVLDAFNGRFCVTPEYPNGTYAYFTTIDANWNSSYPYAVGPTFYGVKTASKVTTISEAVTVYQPVVTNAVDLPTFKMNVYPNPANEVLAVQLNAAPSESIVMELLDLNGRVVMQTRVLQGSTIAYLDTRTVYDGQYFVRLRGSKDAVTQKVWIQH